MGRTVDPRHVDPVIARAGEVRLIRRSAVYGSGATAVRAYSWALSPGTVNFARPSRRGAWFPPATLERFPGATRTLARPLYFDAAGRDAVIANIHNFGAGSVSQIGAAIRRVDGTVMVVDSRPGDDRLRIENGRVVLRPDVEVGELTIDLLAQINLRIAALDDEPDIH